MRREISKQSLIGRVYPCTYRDSIELFGKWRVVLCEPCKSCCIEDWENLEFDFTGHKKKIVYNDLARAFASGWFMKENLSELARYMALHSNLVNNENLKTRTETIRQGIKRELVKFEDIIQYRREHGGIIIKLQQRHLPTHLKVGAGMGVDQNW